MRVAHLSVVIALLGCGDREPKTSSGSQAMAAAENKRKPPGNAEVSVNCYPDLKHLKPGNQLGCDYIVRWTGEPPLFKDDPYYHAKMTLVSADSTVLGPLFPGYP